MGFKAEASHVAQEIAAYRSANGSTRNCRQIELLMLQLAACLFYELKQSEAKETQVLKELTIFQMELVRDDLTCYTKKIAIVGDGVIQAAATAADVNMIYRTWQKEANSTPETEQKYKDAEGYYGGAFVASIFASGAKGIVSSFNRLDITKHQHWQQQAQTALDQNLNETAEAERMGNDVAAGISNIDGSYHNAIMQDV